MMIPVFNLLAGDGIASDGRSVALASEFFAMLDAPNAPGGVVQLNAEGVLEVNSWAIAADTPAAINPTIPQLGELLLKGRTLVVGDDDTAGGLACNLNAENCHFVAADGNAAHVDAKLREGLALVAGLEPFGAAASATNMRRLILGPGTYTLNANSAGHLVVPSFVSIEALIPGTVRIATASDSKLVLRQASSGADHVGGLRGLELVGEDSLRFDFALDLDGTGFGFVVDHRHLRFTGLADDQNTMSFVANQLTTIGNKHSPKLSGYVYDCHSPGRRFYGGHGTTASNTPFAYDVHWERCTAGGHRSFGSSQGTPFATTLGVLEGSRARILHCAMGGSTSENWTVRLNCPFIGNEWNGAIQRLDTSAYLRNSVIRGVVSSHSVNHAAAVDVKMFNLLLANAIGTNVTNLLGSASDTFIRISSAA